MKCQRLCLRARLLSSNFLLTFGLLKTQPIESFHLLFLFIFFKNGPQGIAHFIENKNEKEEWAFRPTSPFRGDLALGRELGLEAPGKRSLFELRSLPKYGPFQLRPYFLAPQAPGEPLKGSRDVIKTSPRASGPGSRSQEREGKVLY